jgi:hypothetical protein
MSEVKLKQNDLSRLVLIRAVIIVCPTVPLGAGPLAGPHVGPDACAIAEGRIFAAASSATCRFTNPVRAKGLEPGAEDLALFAEVAAGRLATDGLRERVLSRYRRCAARPVTRSYL